MVTANMAPVSYSPWTRCSYLLLLILLVFAVIIAFPILFIRQGDTSLHQLFWAKPAHSRCNSNQLASHPHTFTYGRHDAENDSTSLLSQADRILADNAGNEFIQLKENGSKPKRYGVSMLHQLHCLEMIRSAVYESAMSSHHSVKREVDREDHMNHCFQYLKQVRLCLLPAV